VIALKQWLSPVRIAASLLIAEGVILAVNASGTMSHVLRHWGSQPERVAAGPLLLYLVMGLVYICIGSGILYGMQIWRAIGSMVIGLSLGGGLAIIVATYWPLGQQAWDSELLVTLAGLALLGYQLWAVTNVEARTYCCR
jgi:hypothetical protein